MVRHQPNANSEEPIGIECREDAQNSSQIEALERNRASFLIFSQQQPRYQESAEDEKHEHSQIARKSIKTETNTKVIEHNQKHSDGSNSIERRNLRAIQFGVEGLRQVVTTDSHVVPFAFAISCRSAVGVLPSVQLAERMISHGHR